MRFSDNFGDNISTEKVNNIAGEKVRVAKDLLEVKIENNKLENIDNDNFRDKIKEVDGDGSGIDCDLIRGHDFHTNLLNGMKNRFYVDQSHGDDNNDGRSDDKAFKSLNKAFSQIPAGGHGEVIVIGKYVNNDYNTSLPYNSSITLVLTTNSYIEVETLYDSRYDKAVIPTIHLNNSVLRIHITTNDDVPDEAKIKFKQTDPNGYLDKNLRPTNAGFFSYPSEGSGVATLSQNTRIRDNDVIVFELKKGYLFFRRNWSSDFSSTPIMNVGVTHYKGKLARFTSDDAKIIDIYKTAIVNLKGTIIDSDGNSISYVDRINGIRRDSDSGNPINIMSVHNFSS